MTYSILYIDTETTSLPQFNKGKPRMSDPYVKPDMYKGANIVQIGAIYSVGPKQIEMKWTPRDHINNIQPQAQKINKIVPSMADCDMSDAFDTLKDIDFDFIVGHNPEFDVNMLINECRILKLNDFAKKLKTTPRFCTAIMSTDYQIAEGWKKPPDTPAWWTSPSFLRLGELHQRLFGESFENSHDALADIRATKRCFERLIERNEFKHIKAKLDLKAR